MNGKVVFTRSSNLVSWPVMGVGLLGCVLAAFFSQAMLSGVLMLLVLVAFFSRLWGMAAANHVQVSVRAAAQGLFPGEETTFEIEVKNEKFLPVIWMELFMPLAKTLCLTPQDVRKPDDWERVELTAANASEELVGEKRLSVFLWYETANYTSRWKANRRGVYSNGCWSLRTGDGFGLTQIACPIPQEDVRRFAVYPKLVPVKTDLFTRNLWNADTGDRGVMEDLTVIRSTRDYQTTDSLKYINWRLAARALPLTVNVYEDILPQSIHILFDGESFSGKEPHPEAMEDALSVLASILVQLKEQQVSCGLSLCRGEDCEAVHLAAEAEIEEKLYALAAYQPLKPLRDTEKNELIPQKAEFLVSPIRQSVQSVGRFYYIAYDTDSIAARELLLQLGADTASLLTYAEADLFGEFEVLGLDGVKEAQHVE